MSLEGVKQGRGCWRLGETLLSAAVAGGVKSHGPAIRRGLWDRREMCISELFLLWNS